MMRFTDYAMSNRLLTAYRNPPKVNSVLIKLSIGQYMAKNKGTKRFNNGITVDLWAAITNVSKDDYGEDGFRKVLSSPRRWI